MLYRSCFVLFFINIHYVKSYVQSNSAMSNDILSDDQYASTAIGFTLEGSEEVSEFESREKPIRNVSTVKRANEKLEPPEIIQVKLKKKVTRNPYYESDDFVGFSSIDATETEYLKQDEGRVKIVLSTPLNKSLNNSLKSRFMSEKEKKEVLNDLPKKYDLRAYIMALGRVMDYFDSKSNLARMDLNVYMSLFFVDVNLHHAFRKSTPYLPETLRRYLEDLLLVNKELTDYFKLHFKKTKFNKKHFNATLLNESSHWSHHLKKFNTSLMKKTELKDQETVNKIFKQWDHLFDNQFLQRKGVANISHCLVSISEMPNNTKDHPCGFSNRCRHYFSHGPDVAYFLTHRVLTFLLAKHLRGCNVLSVQRDKTYVARMCMKMFGQAEFIYKNDKHTDLLAEMISLCSMDGHTQFVRRSWLQRILEMQSSDGSFLYYDPDLNVYRLLYGAHSFKEWDTHVMATANVALAAGARYVLETHYDKTHKSH